MKQNAWIWATALLTVGVGLSAEEAMTTLDTAKNLPTEPAPVILESATVEVQTAQQVLVTEETASKDTTPVIQGSSEQSPRFAKRMAPAKPKTPLSAAQAVMEEETRLYYESDE